MIVEKFWQKLIVILIPSETSLVMGYSQTPLGTPMIMHASELLKKSYTTDPNVLENVRKASYTLWLHMHQ